VTSTDTSQIDVKPLKEKTFPGREPYRVHITREAYDTVWNHAREAPPDCEVGGMLVGEVYRDKRGPYLDIQAAIVAEHTKNEDTQLTFTQESWIQVNKIKDSQYPELSIVGWYHTHPRFGIFLSDRDSFIQSTSFSQPWAIAMVVDPVQDLEGFFIWQEGQLKLAQEYWVGTEKRDKSRARPSEDERSEKKETKPVPLLPTSPVSRAAFIFTVALAVVVLCGLFVMVYMSESRHAGAEMIMYDQLNKQGQILNIQNQMLNAQQQELDLQQKVLGECNKELQDVQTSLKQLGSNQSRAQLEVNDVQNALQILSQRAATLEQEVAQGQKMINQLVAPPPPADKSQPKTDKSQPKQEKK
jgi:proteasome lid subunit RPN8/RPN11